MARKNTPVGIPIYLTIGGQPRVEIGRAATAADLPTVLHLKEPGITAYLTVAKPAKPVKAAAKKTTRRR